MAEVIIDFVGQSNMKPVEDSLNKIDGLLDEQKAKYNQINQDAGKVAGTMNATGKAAGKAAEEFDKLSKSAKDTGKALSEGIGKKVTDEIVKAGKAADETAKQFKTAKAELRELQNQIISGKLSGEQLVQAQKRAAELKDEISDVSGAIKMMASDTRLFDLAVEGARGIAAAFSVAQGAAAVFGDENKELQQSLMKVQGAMAILTGVQEIANVATTKGGIATVAYGYALKGVEVIQKTFAAASAATWAAATAGVTLLISGIAALAIALSRANDEQKDYVKNTDDVIKKEEELNNLRDKKFNAQLKRLQAEGASSIELAKARQAQIAQEIIDKDKLIKEIEKENLAGQRRNVAEAERQKRNIAYSENESYYLKRIQDAEAKINEEKNKEKKIRDQIQALQIEKDLLTSEDKQLNLDITEELKKQQEEEKKKSDEASKAAQKRKQEKEEEQKRNALAWLEDQKRSQEAARLIEDNRKLQEGLERDFLLTRQEIDDEYLAFVMANMETGRTSFAEFEAQKRAELEKTKQAEIQAAKEKANIDATLQKNRELQLGLQKDFNKSQQEIDDEYANWLKGLKTGEKDDFVEFEKFKREEYKKSADLKKQLDQEVAQFAFDTAKTAFDAIFEIDRMNRQARTEQELGTIEATRDAEIAKVEKQAMQGVITKEQEEAKKTAIEKKYREQQRAIKVRDWEAERQAKLSQAMINGALAITNILTMPFSNPITQGLRIAAVIATTAAQVAVIASTPPPKFAKGTKGGKKTPAGFKIVGEEGPELIYTPGGEKVITAPDTAKILDAYNIKTAKMPNMEKTKTDVSQVPIFDYGKLSQAVAGELSKQPRLQVNIDEKGFTKRLIEGRQRIEFMQNKYKFN